MWREYKDLSNGQVAMLQAVRVWNANGCEEWQISIAIGNHRKQCRMAIRGTYVRRRKKRRLCDQTTGRCGLEGMRAIKTLLTEFTTWVDSANCNVNIVCVPYDTKRKRAYAYLKRMGYKYIDKGYNCDDGYYLRQQWY